MRRARSSFVRRTPFTTVSDKRRDNSRSSVFVPFTVLLTAGARPWQLGEVMKFYLGQTHGFRIVKTAAAAAATAPQSEASRPDQMSGRK